MTRIRRLLRGMAVLGYRVWCPLCNAEFSCDVELGAHLASAHPRGK